MKEGNRTPCFYGLPKIHKQYSTFPPLRPICSGYNACTVKISKFVDHHLKPIARRSSSYVKDTTDFILKLRQNKSSHLLENDPFLVTIDVESLYPNTDREEGTQACQYYFTTTGLSPTISRYLCKLILLVLRSNTLRFEARFFRQIKGTAMGTPKAVNFANLFMSKFESDMLNDYEAQYGCRPAYWARFVDDVFFIWTGDEASSKVFLNFCNNYSKSQNRKSSIRFTSTYSKQRVVFLDTIVHLESNQLYTELCSKPTSAHQYLHRTSFHHVSLIKSLPKSQFIRIRRICSKLSDYKHHTNVFVHYFAARGFNRRKLESMANLVSQMNRDDLLNKPAEKEASQNRIPFVLNWHTNFRDFGTIIHRNYRKMLSEYPKIKSVFPPHLFSPFEETKTSRAYWSDFLSHNHQTNHPQPWVNLTITLVLFVLQ